MHRKFLLAIVALLCILIGLSACQTSQQVDNSLHTQTPAGSATSTIKKTPEATTPAPTPTVTETPTKEPTKEPTTTTKAPTKTPTKAPTKKPTSTPKPTSGKTYNLPYILYVNCTQNVVTVYSADKQGKAVTPLKVMLCSTGRNNNTGEGTFYISDKYVWRPLFGNVYGQYACRFNGSILFHSVPYKSKNKASLKAEEFNKLGTPASDGCVRLNVEDCKWIYDNCASGTKVVVYASNDPEPFEKPAGIKIPLTSTWDPTDPDVKNPWHSQIPVMPITFSGLPTADVEVQRNQALPDLLKGVTAVDSMGVDVTDKITLNHTLNMGKIGSYVATYQVVNGATQETAKVHVTYRVVDKTAPVISGLTKRWIISGANVEITTTERLLRNVTVTDDGDSISIDKVTATINGQPYTPELLQPGIENEIVFAVEDEGGNVATETVIVIVSGTRPTPTPTPTPEPTPTPTPTPDMNDSEP